MNISRFVVFLGTISMIAVLTCTAGYGGEFTISGKNPKSGKYSGKYNGKYSGKNSGKNNSKEIKTIGSFVGDKFGKEIGGSGRAGGDLFGDECERMEERARRVCCSLEDKGELPDDQEELPHDTVTVRDCETGEEMEIACVRRDAVQQGEIEIPLNEQEPLEVNPECLEAMEEMQDEGCIDKDEEVAIQCDDVAVGGGVRRGLPTCESLEAFVNSFREGNHCEPIPESYFTAALYGTPVFEDGEMHIEPEETDFQALPGDAAQGDGPPSQPPDTLLPEDEMNRTASPFRLEVPGNFLRYFIRRAAFRPALQQMHNPRKGINCDPDDLWCTINVLKAADGRGVMEDVVDGVDALEMWTEDTDEGFTITKIRTGVPGVMSATWRGNIFFRPFRGQDMVINFGRDGRLPLVPMMDPKGANGYETELDPLVDKGFYLDRTWVVTNIFADECKELAEQTVDVKGNEISANGVYLTYRQPYKCHCEQLIMENYCVVDPYPRVEMVSELSLEKLRENGARVREVFCSDPLWVNAFMVDQDPALPRRVMFDEYYGRNPNFPLEELRNDVEEFGCTSKKIPLVPLVAQEELAPDLRMPEDGAVAPSASGIAFGGYIQSFGIEAFMEKGTHTIWIELEFVSDLVEWLKKRWYTWILGWLLDWIQKMYSAILSVYVTSYLHMATTPLANSAYVVTDTASFGVEGILSHEEGEVELEGEERPRHVPEATFEIRRVHSSKPSVKASAMDFDVELPACRVEQFEDVDGPGEFLEVFFRLVVGCPFQMFEELTELTLYPLTRTLYGLVDVLTGFSQKLTDTFNETVITTVNQMEVDHGMAELFHSSASSIIFDPAFYLEERRRDLINPSMATMFNTVCAAGHQPETTCCMAQLFSGTLLDPVEGGTTIDRIGTKTHYRSMQDFERMEISNRAPPVRYCAAGDNPLGDPNKLYTRDDFDTLTDLNEIDIGHRIVDLGDDQKEVLPLNWQSQCAFHIDFDFTASTQIQKIRVQVHPTKRTNLLVNEVFFCRDNHDCDPDIANAPIRDRADLASCSMTADLWFQEKSRNTSGPIKNVMLSATDDNPVYFNRLVNEVRNATRCNIMPDSFKQYLIDCHQKLIQAGFTVPERPPWTLEIVEGVDDDVLSPPELP